MRASSALKDKLAELRSQRAARRAARRQPHRRRRADQAGRQGRARAGIARTFACARQAGRHPYDRALYDAVRRLQYRHGIKPTGVIDNKTIAAINGPKPLASQKIDRVAANMERWRWLPRDLGNTYVMVNIPDLHAQGGARPSAVVWRTKIVVGKPQTPTPLLDRVDG